MRLKKFLVLRAGTGFHLAMGQVDDSTGAKPSALEKGRATLIEMARWKKIMLAIAGVMILLGLVIGLLEGGRDRNVTVTPGSTPTGGAGLVPGAIPPPGGANAQESGSTWSPAFLKMGFGFFVGFAIGFTLRTFLKFAVLACGLLFLALFGLSSAGLITVEWETMGNVFEGWFANIGEQTKGLQSLITGSLPATGLGAFGLYAGLRKN